MKREEKKRERDAARKRVAALFEVAGSATAQDSADRAVMKAREVGQREQVRLSRKQRQLFCRKCGAFWRARTVRVRIREGRMVYLCMMCKHIVRFPFKGPKRVQKQGKKSDRNK